MVTRAFKDSGDGYYQVDIPIGDPIPSWLSGMTEIPVQAAPSPSLKVLAENMLPETDMVALRCTKAWIVFPSEWQSYTVSLRNIANGTDTTSTSLPAKPAYPAGT